MFGKFDSPNKKTKMASTKTPQLQHPFQRSTKGPRWSPQRPAASLHRPGSGVYWEIPASPTQRIPATDDGNPASWIYEAETKRNSPQWKVRFTASTKISKKMTGFKLPTKITCIKYQWYCQENKLLVTKSDWVCSRGMRVRSLDKDSPKPSSACLENVPFPTSAWGPSAGTMPAPAKSS